jgi:Ankyrin repeats (3 copies)
LQITSYLDPIHLAVLGRTSSRYLNFVQDKLYDLALTYTCKLIPGSTLTVLQWAVWDIPNRGKTFHALIQKGADIYVKDRSGNTLLHDLCLQGHKDAVELVIQSGLYPGTRNSFSVAPLIHAAGGGYADLVQYILCEALDV